MPKKIFWVILDFQENIYNNSNAKLPVLKQKKSNILENLIK